MAKDDYYVIVYQILAYLYHCLKQGATVKPQLLSADSDYFKINGQSINQRYWAYVICNLYQKGLIDGVIFADIDNLPHPFPIKLDDCMITPDGIEYLAENSMLAKAKNFLKDIKAIVPYF